MVIALSKRVETIGRAASAVQDAHCVRVSIVPHSVRMPTDRHRVPPIRESSAREVTRRQKAAMCVAKAISPVQRMAVSLAAKVATRLVRATMPKEVISLAAKVAIHPVHAIIPKEVTSLAANTKEVTSLVASTKEDTSHVKAATDLRMATITVAPERTTIILMPSTA